MIINKPPMGWNTWNTFGQNISEDLILKMADLIVQSGLKDVGYEYVVIDDCWALKERDEQGRLVPDPAKFPHGMKYLADKIHAKGLKLGMYSCSGLMTCAKYPSSLDREWVDAQSFAEWDIDYLKYDFCFKPANRRADELYRTMGLALRNSGKDILFSACNWGYEDTQKWIKTTGANMWRSTEDIFDNWPKIKEILLKQLDLLQSGGKGCFNDMDMLVVGMHGKGNVGLGGCTDKEYRTHFAAWCLLQSPLMIGCDLSKIDQTSMELLKNKKLIEINQDELAAQSYFVSLRHALVSNEKLGLVRPLANGDLAIGLFNLTDDKRQLFTSLYDYGIKRGSGMTLELENCFTGEITRPDNDVIWVDLEAHDCVVYRAKIVKA